jgi:peptidoglycan/xylan/chitin deacetylase (PgdA/CDA1 family)
MGPFPKYVRLNTIIISAFVLWGIAAIVGAPWWLYVFVLLIGMTITYLGTTQIASNFHLPAYCKAANSDKKEIAITFDDGVLNPMQSKLVLDVLKQYEVPATFFCIGKNLASKEQVQVLKRMDAEGHIIGNHSFSHANLFDFFSSKRVVQEILDTDKVIQQHLNKQPLFFRPPYGITTPKIAKAMRQVDHKTIGWSLRSLDTVIKDEKMLLKRVEKKLKKGDIVLFHDHLEFLPRFLPLFLDYLLKEGYTVVGLDQLLQLQAYKKTQ